MITNTFFSTACHSPSTFHSYQLSYKLQQECYSSYLAQFRISYRILHHHRKASKPENIWTLKLANVRNFRSSKALQSLSDHRASRSTWRMSGCFLVISFSIRSISSPIRSITRSPCTSMNSVSSSSLFRECTSCSRLIYYSPKRL